MHRMWGRIRRRNGGSGGSMNCKYCGKEMVLIDKSDVGIIYECQNKECEKRGFRHGVLY